MKRILLIGGAVGEIIRFAIKTLCLNKINWDEQNLCHKLSRIFGSRSSESQFSSYICIVSAAIHSNDGREISTELRSHI